MAIYKYTVDSVERTPLNSGEFTIDESLTNEGGGYFLRKSLSSSIRFGGADYQYLKQQTDICRFFEFKIQKQFKVTLETLYTGRFTLLNCEFNDDLCQVTVSVETLDQYTCLLQNWDKSFNVAQITDTSDVFRVERVLFVEIAIGFDDGVNPPAIVATNGSETDSSNYGDFIEQFTNAYLDPLGIPNSIDLITYCRELVYTACVNGVPQEPQGTGWTLESGCSASSNGFGYSLWWRRLDYSTSFTLDLPLSINDPNILSVDVVDPIPDPNEWGFMLFNNYMPGTYGIYYNRLYLGDLSSELRSRYVKGGRDFLTVGKTLLDNACSGGYAISSSFFTDTLNPVTGTTNICKDLQLWTKSDAANAQLTEALAQDNIQAADKELSPREYLEDTQTHFNTEWYIDENNPKTVILEHISDTRPQVVDLDLTLPQYADTVKNKNAYRYSVESVPVQERWRFITASLPDFTGQPIDYNGCGNEIDEYSTSQIDTELDLLIGDEEQRSLDGFILVQPDSIKSSDSLAQVGIFWAFYAPNMPLSISNLHDKFWKYQRKLPSGKLNNISQTFISYQKLLEQNELVFTLCNPNSFDRRKLVRTQYGECEIVATSYNLTQETMAITLRFNL